MEFVEHEFDAITALFKGHKGKVVKEILERRFCNRLSYTTGDPMETAFKEGQRQLALAIVAAASVGVSPEDTVLITPDGMENIGDVK